MRRRDGETLTRRARRRALAARAPFTIVERRDRIRRGHSMTDVVVEYLGALQAERGASRNTLGAYRRDLTDFTRFLHDQHRTLAPRRPRRYRRIPRAPADPRPAPGQRRATHLGAARALQASGPRGRASPRSHRESRDAAAARALPRTLSRDVAAALVESPDLTAAARRTRSRRARAALRHRHARLRVSGADPGRRQSERGLRGVHGKGTQAAPRSGRRRGRAVGQSLPPRHPALYTRASGQRPRCS